jgi:GNAT superfamily N-acetyltransferase
MVNLTFKPVTRGRSNDFESLFEAKGGPKYCWCMAWRPIPGKRQDSTPADRKKLMLDNIARGTPVGLLGYDAGEAVAWVSIAPRDTYLPLGGPDAEDGQTIWSLACMFIRRDHRGEGLAHQLIDAATKYARKRGADIIEAYPVAPDAPSYRYMGFVPAFDAAGYRQVGKAGTRRHVMRFRPAGDVS